MNRLLLILLAMALVAVSLFANEQAGATEGKSVLGKAELEKIFTDQVLGSTSLPRHDLEIANFHANPDSLELPAGAPEFHIISRTENNGLGRQTIVVNVLVNGQPAQRVTLSGDLALYGEVVCAVRYLPAHHIVSADDLKQVRRNLTMLGPDLVTDLSMALGKEIKTTLQPGAVIYGRFLRAPDLVKQGDIVSIIAVSDSLKITVPGRVETAGAKGETVKVKNLMSRKEIYARVIGPETVQTEL
jgi:flagella basal body P-ring formation protein FlgA